MPTYVIKIGGALLSDDDALAALWSSVAALRGRGVRVVVVHGGGPQATAMARRLGHEPRIVHGRRVTGDLDLEIVQWTLRGTLNTHLVAQAARLGLRAVGLSGVDGGLLRVMKRPPWDVDGEEVDFGWVGDVDGVDTAVLDALLGAGCVPVVAPLGSDGTGRVYNVNADTVAQEVARAVGATRFLLVTESGGVRRDAAVPASRLDCLDAAAYDAGLTDGWIRDGMRVKLRVAFDALRAGIPDVYILAPDDLLDLARATRIVA